MENGKTIKINARIAHLDAIPFEVMTGQEQLCRAAIDRVNDFIDDLQKSGSHETITVALAKTAIYYSIRAYSYNERLNAQNAALAALENELDKLLNKPLQP